jgi:hypothetical protein
MTDFPRPAVTIAERGILGGRYARCRTFLYPGSTLVAQGTDPSGLRRWGDAADRGGERFDA